MPNPHFDISIVQRSKGKSAVAGAAYQSGEKLFSEYMIITSARVVVSEHIISNIFSTIENKLLDLLMILEKELRRIFFIHAGVQLALAIFDYKAILSHFYFFSILTTNMLFIACFLP